MTPPRQRKGGGGPAEPEQIQPRPADQFPPNPVRQTRQGPEEPEERLYEVTGPKEVGGVRKPGKVRLTLTRAQEVALIQSGNATPAKEEDHPEPEPPEPETESVPDETPGEPLREGEQ